MLQIRYDGTDTALPVNFEHGSITQAKGDFETVHKAQFGFVYDDKPMIVESVGVEGIDTGGTGREESDSALEDIAANPAENRKIFADGTWRDANIFPRETLKPGNKVAGPALIIEPNQTIVVEPGWQAEITAKNHVLLRRIEKKRRQAALGTEADPVMLEVFNNLFMSIAEQMGVTLQNTAYSVNIKERLDFPAPSSTVMARWSPMRRTCRCISAPWTVRWKPSSGSTPATFTPATSLPSTRPTMAAPICLTLRW